MTQELLAARVQQQLVQELDRQLRDIRQEMLRSIEAVTLELLEAEQVVLSEEGIGVAVDRDTISQSFDQQLSSRFGTSIERGIGSAVSGGIRTGNFNARRLVNPVLRQTGRELGQRLGASLFDRQGGGLRLGAHQLGGRLLSGLFRSNRNQ